MEPQDGPFAGDQYNQLENFFMDESTKGFQLLELSQSNPSQSNNNPSPLQCQHNRDGTTRAANGGGDDVTNAQHTISPSDNNDGPPPGFSSHMAQRKSNGLSSGNSASSLKITYIVQAPSTLQPVQWSSPVQTSNLAQPLGATSSPNPLVPVPTTTLVGVQYSNHIQQTLMSTSTTQSGQSTNPSSSASASTQPPAHSNLPPPPATNMPPPPQAPPCNNNNTLHAPTNNTNYFSPSTNNCTLSQQTQSNNGDQLALNPYPNTAQPVAIDHNAGSSSIASRFAAAAQGASMGNMRTVPYAPSGFMTFVRPNSTDVSSQHNAYVHGAQMDAASYGTVQVPGGGLETGLLPMYSSSTFQDLALMAQHNNNLARKKQQQQQGSAAKKPRGRPKGGRKKNPPPQWEEVEYDVQELEQHARKPYNVRRAEWQDLKLSGAIPGRGPLHGDQMMAPMAFDNGGQAAGWDCPNSTMMMMNNYNHNSYDNNQGQNGGIPNPSNHPGGSHDQNLSRVENAPAEVGVVHHQLPTTQFGNAASEVAVHPVPPRQAGTNMTTTFAYNNNAAPAPSSGVLPPAENPSKFWSFGTNPHPTVILPASQQNIANNNDSMMIVDPEAASVVSNKGKQPIGSSNAPAPCQNKTCGSCSNNEHQSGGTNNGNVNVGGTTTAGSFSNSVSHESSMQFWGGHQSTYIDFENGCFGVAVQGRRVPSGSKRCASAAAASGNIKNPKFSNSYEDAAVQVSNTSCNKQPLGSSTAQTSGRSVLVESNINNNNPSMHHHTSLPNKPVDNNNNNNNSNNQVVSADQYPISVSDYINDYDGMQLTDEDYIAGAFREQIIAQPTDHQPPMQQQVTVQPTQQAATYAHHPVPSVEQQVIRQQLQPMQNGVAGQQVSCAQQAAPSDTNNQPSNSKSNMPPPPQPNFQQNPSPAQYTVQDGNSSVRQAYMQPNQTSNYDTNNSASAHQGSYLQVPNNPSAHQTTNIPRISGPKDFYYYQQHLQQQQANSSVNGLRPYAMLPPLGLQGSINSPVMQHQYYQYGDGTGAVGPSKNTRRFRPNTQLARYPVMDFNQCAITPTMFNDMVHDGSVDSILGSDLWAGLNQDVYNIMVMADPTLLLDPARLQERIAQINSGMLPIPNLLNCIRMIAQQATGFSAPPAANMMMGNSSMMNYALPTGMQPNPTTQQGLGVAAGAANYNNFTDPTARAPQMMMNGNNIPCVHNQQPPNYLQGGQMNANMQQGQPNFGYWHEYPAPPSSSQRAEEMQQPVPVNQPSTILTSAQENVNHNPPYSSSPASAIPLQQYAAPPNTQQAPNQAYNNTKFGVPYAQGGPHV